MDDPVAESGPHPVTVGRERRRELGRTKNIADLYFLLGILAGGPLVSFDIQLTAGLVLVLSGGVASALIRYAAFSAPGALLAASLSALTVVTAVLGPSAADDNQDADTTEAARAAFVGELARRYERDGVFVEARGLGAITVWFHPPAVLETSCGGFPDQPTREHLAALGFKRIVVNIRSEGQGVCSFHP